MTVSSLASPIFQRIAIVSALVLLAVELLAIGLTYKHGIDFNCIQNWGRNSCASASYMLVSVYGLIGAFALYSFLSPGVLNALLQDVGHKYLPIAVNVLGLVIAMVPIAFLDGGSGNGYLVASFTFWIVGMGLLGAGFLWFLAPMERWLGFIKSHGIRLLPLLIGGAIAPYLAILIRPLWQLDAIAGATFDAVVLLTNLLGYDVYSDSESKILGATGFLISVAPVCSGIEGIALVSVFVSLYLWLFRDQLRFPHVLVLYPLGILTSALLNIVRITVLLLIGIEGNPDLAVGGFHSHAGWMMFTVIAIGIVAIANTVPFFQKRNDASPKGVQPLVPFFQDPTIARILPFTVFMISAIFAQAFSETPSLVYPARAAIVAIAIGMFWPVLRNLPWRIDLVAIAIGAVIGVVWIVIPVTDPETLPPYGALTGGLLLLWMIARGIGTAILVPIVEELFFRDYLESKLRRFDTLAWTIGAAVISAVFFAALHGRWAEAFFAALLLSYVARRGQNITDAIVAHAVANGLIFVAAVVSQKMHII